MPFTGGIDISGWDEGVPSGTSLISDGDDEFRRVKSLLSDYLEEEHIFGGNSGTSGGVHRPGSSRVSFANIADIGTAQDEGRLFYGVDDNSLHFQGPSANTTIVEGGSTAQGCKAYQTSGQLVTASRASLQFQAEKYDDGDFFDAGTSATEFTVPADGLYLMICQASTDGATQGWELQIRKGGGTEVANADIEDDWDSNAAMTVEKASAGDIFYADIQKDEGSDVNTATGEGQTFFVITKIK